MSTEHYIDNDIFFEEESETEDNLDCPNCGSLWGIEEIDLQACDFCGYPNFDDFDDFD
jgi:ribosomal protein S27AE